MSTDSTIYASNPATDKAQAMVNAATALMGGLYTLSAGAQTYLPGSYASNDNTKLNMAYTWHDQNPNQVQYPAVKNECMEWSSTPSNDGKYKIGTISAITTPQSINAAVAKSDCSGFLTSLFSHIVNVQGFSMSLSYGKKKHLGCKTGDVIPFAVDFFDMITGKENGITNPDWSDLQAGDIIALGQAADDKNDTGHVLLVMAVEEIDTTTATERQVVVIDCSASVHSSDTRGPNKANAIPGVGMGIIKLSYSKQGGLIFHWGIDSTASVNSNVALGRLN